MTSPRVRRLKRDYERLCERFDGWPIIQMVGKAGLPPEYYRFSYQIKGLIVGAGGEIVERGDHILEVNLSLGYPRRAPQCKMLHPVFHPNFDAAAVCIGDFWAPSEGLDDLIVRIGRMIAYQEYNTKSPLNGLAAKWAAENQSLLPVDSTELAPPLDHSSGLLQPTAGGVVVPEQARPPEDPSSGASPTPSSGETTEQSSDPWTSKIVIS